MDIQIIKSVQTADRESRRGRGRGREKERKREDPTL